MCRGSTTACSRKTVGSPKAPSASRMQVSTASRRSSAVVDPAHPAAAAAGDGLDEQRVAGMASAAATSASTSVDGSTAASVGTPAALAAAIARALLPVSVRTSRRARRR